MDPTTSLAAAIAAVAVVGLLALLLRRRPADSPSAAADASADLVEARQAVAAADAARQAAEVAHAREAARAAALEAALTDAARAVEHERARTQAERATAAEERARAEAAGRHGAAAASVAAAVEASLAAERHRADHAAAIADRLRADLDEVRLELAHRSADLAATEADLLAERRRLEEAVAVERRRTAEQAAAFTDAQAASTERWEAISAAALEQAQVRFLQLAEERFGAARALGAADLDARTTAVDQLVGPMGELLGRVDQRLQALEVSRAETQGVLLEQVRALGDANDRLRGETANLVTALRAPSTRGRWGELHLRRVVELAGLERHCDFDEQVTVAGPDGGLRPDLVVRMPGGLSVVVDAKVPLDAYLRAVDATSEAAAKAAMADHARQLRSHIDALSSKRYWEAFDPTPEAVVLFVPGDAILAAAAEADPSLIEVAAAKKVVLASPSSLILLLRTVAVAWKQEAVADNARKVSQLGRELYKRLSTLGDHLDKAGRGLDRAVQGYNDAVGSLEARVLVTARQLADLEVADGELLAPTPVTRDTRRLGAPELVRPALVAAPTLQAVAPAELPLEAGTADEPSARSERSA